jgi:hypothetical protein
VLRGGISQSTQGIPSPAAGCTLVVVLASYVICANSDRAPVRGSYLRASRIPGKEIDVPTGKYRATINGFTCVAETWDDATNVDGQHDEIYFLTNTKVIKSDGTVRVNSDSPSMTMGDVQGFPDRLQVGTASGFLGHRSGGIVTGNSFPQPYPHKREAGVLEEKERTDPRLYPPYKIWEGTLSDTDTDVVFLTPTIWEWDTGAGALEGWAQWQIMVNARFGGRAKEIFGGIWPVSKPIFDAVSLGIETFATLLGLWSPLGKSMRRPIGLKRDPKNPDGSLFNPTIIALTYDTAEFLCSSNLNGLGLGVQAISFEDDPVLRAFYTIYVQIEKIGNESPSPAVTPWTGWAEVPGNGATSAGPAAVVHNGSLHLFVRGTDDRIYLNRLNRS